MNGIYEISVAVKDFLSQYGAVLRFAPDIELRSLHGASVQVMPFSEDKKRESRAAYENKVVVQVGVMSRVSINDTEKIASLVAEVEEIRDMTVGRVIGGHLCNRAKVDPIYDADQLRTKSFFIGVIHLEFKEISTC